MSIYKEAWYLEALDKDFESLRKEYAEDPELLFRAYIRRGLPIDKFKEEFADKLWGSVSGNFEFWDRLDKLILDYARRGELSGANLQGLPFRYTNLQGSDLSKANLKGVDFHKAFLVDVNFRGANLEGALFTVANLEDANFEEANLQGANFHRAKTVGATFTGANVEDAAFGGSDISPKQLKDTVGDPKHVTSQEPTPSQIETFCQSYIGAMLWGMREWSEDLGEMGIPEYDVDEFAVEQITPESLQEIREDCQSFLREALPYVEGHLSQSGHDFYLTRNHHGAGFWDRGYSTHKGEYLTELSHSYGEQELSPNPVGEDMFGDTQWELTAEG